MKITLPSDADVLELEITIPHSPEKLVVTIDDKPAVYNYSPETNTVSIEDVTKGQVVEIYEQPLRLDGEAPIQVTTYPTFQAVKFRINSLDYLPIDRDEDTTE